jgi:hypothetical protein
MREEKKERIKNVKLPPVNSQELENYDKNGFG